MSGFQIQKKKKKVYNKFAREKNAYNLKDVPTQRVKFNMTGEFIVIIEEFRIEKKPIVSSLYIPKNALEISGSYYTNSCYSFK